MALQKITPEQLAGKGVIPLADQPKMSAAELKARFDQLALAVITPVFNANVDEQGPLNQKITPAAEAAAAALVSAVQALDMAQKALDAVAGGGILVIDPVTGKETSVQQALYNMYDAFRVGALTADEYDALGLTADAYDAYGLTADQYDYQAKILLVTGG